MTLKDWLTGHLSDSSSATDFGEVAREFEFLAMNCKEWAEFYRQRETAALRVELGA